MAHDLEADLDEVEQHGAQTDATREFPRRQPLFHFRQRELSDHAHFDSASCPTMRRQLNEIAATDRTRLFVAMLPLGRSSMPMSLFSSLWNCSLVPWSW